jgi:GT2 family glycosyltransferase
MTQKLALLLTCHNRKNKTLACLTSLYKCKIPDGYAFHIFLVDDGSTDGTALIVKEKFPLVNVITGNGNLFWAGGMRLAWSEAIRNGYDTFLLINDDVELYDTFFKSIIETHQYALEHFGVGGLYVSSTIDERTNTITYGGTIVKKTPFGNINKMVIPSDIPISCQITNANILFVSADVVKKIGTFNNRYTHALADYDYSMTAYENRLPVLVCPGIGGHCENDHIKNWLSVNSTFKERLGYLYSPKGLAYKDFLYYIRKHFPLSLPYFFSMLWLKTFFPAIWDKYK